MIYYMSVRHSVNVTTILADIPEGEFTLSRVGNGFFTTTYKLDTEFDILPTLLADPRVLDLFDHEAKPIK